MMQGTSSLRSMPAVRRSISWTTWTTVKRISTVPNYSVRKRQFGRQTELPQSSVNIIVRQETAFHKPVDTKINTVYYVTASWVEMIKCEHYFWGMNEFGFVLVIILHYILFSFIQLSPITSEPSNDSSEGPCWQPLDHPTQI